MSVDLDHIGMWKIVQQEVNDVQRAMVSERVKDASSLLDRVIETFPTFTLHNSIHAENVAKLMENLLGPRVSDLSGLEASLLILSAFYHDVGMVFDDTSREQLSKEPEWREFLRRVPEARLELKESRKKEVPKGVAEWYCRWRHADRVFIYLNALSHEQLVWGSVNLSQALGELCRSHMRSASFIQRSEILQTNFLGEADLKFCALILRLSDILDFDRSRSPAAVYGHLGLSRRDSPRKSLSDVEWRKHLVSDGFKFPRERNTRYPLDFIAGPNHPAVEYDVRQFLDIIDKEIEECRGLLGSCSEKWRDFVLPFSVDRSNIKSQGYTYGEYRLSMDHTQVVDLLMGDRLYEDPYTFVRELLQNAIDTSRHRRYVERAGGKLDFEPAPIRVSTWRDEKGYQWVRFDDFGMGMDDEIIRDFFLRVGSSYYKSARFKAESIEIQARTKSKFTPISRFGLGIISCFIVGDRVEVNTVRHSDSGCDPSKAVRLSIHGKNGFYVVQRPPLVADPTPIVHGHESGYRRKAGTTVAVRIDPRKQATVLDVASLLRKHVLASPIAVQFDNLRLGGEEGFLLAQPCCEPMFIDLRNEHIHGIESLLSYKFSHAVQLEVSPIDLTRNSPTPELQGQIVCIGLKWSEERQKLSDALSAIGQVTETVSYDTESGKLVLRVSLDADPFDPEKIASDAQFALALESISSRIKNGKQGSEWDVDPKKPAQFIVSDIGEYEMGDEEEVGEESAEGHDETLESEDELIRDETHDSDPRGVFNREGDWVAVPDVNDRGFNYFGAHAQFEIPLNRLVPRKVIDFLALVEQRAGANWGLLAHNGVTVPGRLKWISGSGIGDQVEPSWEQPLSLISEYGDCSHWGIVGLFDSLRPDLVISRDTLRTMPWNICSTAALTISRAVRNTALANKSARFFSFLDEWEQISLREFLDDPLLTDPNGWCKEPVFDTLAGPKSVEHIIEEDTVQFLFLPGMARPGTYYEVYIKNPGVSDLCAKALAQIHLNVYVEFEGHKINGFFASGEQSSMPSEGLKHFPPLTFVPYRGSDALMWQYCGVNLKHPLAKWLIRVAPCLFENYAGILSQISAELQRGKASMFFDDSDEKTTIGWKPKTIRETINGLLLLLREHRDAEVTPPDDVFVKEDDLVSVPAYSFCSDNGSTSSYTVAR